MKPLFVRLPIAKRLGEIHVKLGENKSKFWRIRMREIVARGQWTDGEGSVEIGGYGLHAEGVEGGTDQLRRII